MYAQVDTDDHIYNLMDDIIDCTKEHNDVGKADKYIVTISILEINYLKCSWRMGTILSV